MNYALFVENAEEALEPALENPAIFPERFQLGMIELFRFGFKEFFQLIDVRTLLIHSL